MASLEMGIRPGEWYLRHYAPVLRSNKKKNANRNRASATRKEAADKAVRDVYETWKGQQLFESEAQAYRAFYKTKIGRELSLRKTNRLRGLLGLTKK